VLVTVLVTAIGGGVAHASSVTVAGGVMTITANPGESNNVSFSAAGSDMRGPLITVSDTGSKDLIPNTSTTRLVALPPCNQTSDGRGAFCPIMGLTMVVANLGDQDDTWTGPNLNVPTHVDLGPGMDTANVGASTAADDITGGTGVDTVSYASRQFFGSSSVGVAVTLDDIANDGTQSPMEKDNIRSDVENVTGSSRNDTLGGSSSANRLDGGLGSDTFQISGGGDFYELRDGVADKQFCVNGGDTVDSDLHDPPILPCAIFVLTQHFVIPPQVLIFSGAVHEGPNLRVVSRTLHIGRGGQVAVKASCPRGLAHGCKGTLSLLLGTSKLPLLGRASYKLKSGHRGTVRIHLRAGAISKARKRGLVIVKALEHGQLGLKTTLALRKVS
jgi:hypothetical protein